LIFDAHCHIGREHSGSRPIELSVDELIKSMDKNNISKAVICPLGKGLVVQNAKANEEIATAVKKFPDRLVGFAGANPWQEDELPSPAI
jgi:Tat protein secretion system quality control protein TatD with DNase activity